MTEKSLKNKVLMLLSWNFAILSLLSSFLTIIFPILAFMESQFVSFNFIAFGTLVPLLGYLFGWIGVCLGTGEAKMTARFGKNISIGLFVICLINLLMCAPNYVGFKDGQRNFDVWHAGDAARYAQGDYFKEHITFTSKLDDLIEFNKELVSNPEITFVFLYSSDSGFTFYTQHSEFEEGKYYFTRNRKSRIPLQHGSYQKNDFLTRDETFFLPGAD